MFTETKACCARPPVILSDIAGGYSYTPKGTYKTYHGIETYETGPSTSKRGILMIYDVFGMFIQTIRGADILATGTPISSPDTAGDYQVFMPDFFGDNPSDLTTFPPKTPSQIKFTQAFMSGPAALDKHVPTIAPLMEELQKAHPEIESWAVLGFCWGGKIAALVTQEGTLFKASGQCHPSLLDTEDAKKAAVPMLVLPSMDEDRVVLAEYEKNLKVAAPESYFEIFEDQVHGWMNSRADFNNLHSFDEYLRGYRIARTFFAQFL